MTSTAGADDNVLNTSAPRRSNPSQNPSTREEFLGLLAQAIDRQATDLFIEPKETTGEVNFRINGRLVNHSTITKEKSQQYINILADAASLPQHRLRQPTHGKIKVFHKRVAYEFKVAFAPTLSGTTATVRLDSNKPRELDEIGFEPEQLSQIKRALAHPSGLVVIAGQTGTGKTSTAEALLRHLEAGQRLIAIQLGSPIEYPNPNRSQIELTKEITWKEGLQAAINFNADIIETGDIRTGEQAKMLVEAALRGPLVICTIHARDAASAINRLQRMGVESYQLGATLKLVIAQELRRQLCPHCRFVYRPGFDRDKQTAEAQITLAHANLKLLAQIPATDTIGEDILSTALRELHGELSNTTATEQPAGENILSLTIARLNAQAKESSSQQLRERAAELAITLERHRDPRTAPGCDKCSGTGYTSRTIISEVLPVTAEITHQLERQATGERIMRHATLKDGVLSMAAIEARKVSRGLIASRESIEEPPDPLTQQG